jgi:AraC family transcriptional regulator, positive regulator of tynA and feaB
MMSVTTHLVRLRERAEFWTDLVSRHVTPIRIEPAGTRELRGEIRARPIGNLGIARVSGQGVHALHTSSHIARARAHVHAACVNLRGEARIICRGAVTTLQPGDIFITDSREEFTLDLGSPWRHLLVTLPTALLDSRVARPERIAGAVLRSSPLAQLWASHLAAGFGLSGEISPAGAAMFARHSIELLVQLLDETPGEQFGQSESFHAALYARACEIIALRYSDPEINPARIAGELGVSSRTLVRVFSARNETVMRRVFDERLRQAVKLLATRDTAHRSVTQIAFTCGFNDISHFGRIFARRMHTTPSQWRRRDASRQ